MQDAASLRASDSDREQVADRLHHAMAEGRLSENELEQRLEALYAARTYGELDALHADLPVNPAPGQPRVRLGRLVGAVSGLTLVVMVLGVLAVLFGRTAVAVLGSERRRHFNSPGPLAGPHQGLMIVASLGAAAVVLLTAAAVLWAVMDSRPMRRP